MKTTYYRIPLGSGIIIFLLCIAGLYISLDLTWLHYRVHTDPEFHSFCAISDSFNCETVAESPYSVFLQLPVSVWGILAYLIMGILALAALFPKKKDVAHELLLIFSGISVIVSIILAIVSYCVICSICILCSTTYGINVALFFLLVFSTKIHLFPWRRTIEDTKDLTANHWVVLLCGFLFIAALIAGYPKYWDRKQHRDTKIMTSGSTLNTSPWIGAVEPDLTVTEYSDYLCPHCRRGHVSLRQLVAANPGRVKLIHRHFPLDDQCNRLLISPFHPGACFLAKAAYCAGEQGKFWDMNDRFVYDSMPSKRDYRETVASLAERILPDVKAFNDCLASKRAEDAIKEDIEAGLSLEIKGTPSLVVDNKVYLGVLPQEILAQLQHDK